MAAAPFSPRDVTFTERRTSVASSESLGSTDGALRISGDGAALEQAHAPLSDQTLTGLILSGKITTFASVDQFHTIQEEEEDGFDDIPLIYFPDPPCVLPPEEEFDVYDHETQRKSVVDYWKEHAKTYDCWPKVKKMRELNHDLVKKLGGGLLRTSSIMEAKLVVNVTNGQIGVRSSTQLEDYAKTGEVIEPGEMVIVKNAEDRDGVRYWKLKNSEGYVFETKGDMRVMHEAMNVESGMWWYRVACEECLEVRVAPGYGDDLRTGWVLTPGELVVVCVRCRIGSSQFLLLQDGRGWAFTWKPVLCAGGAVRAGHDVALEECSTDFVEKESYTDFRRAIPPTDAVVEVGSWTYVVQQRPILCVGTKEYGTFLNPGDIVKVNKRANASGSMHNSEELQERVWIRLLDGRGWVPIYGDDGMELVKEQDPTDLTYPAWFRGNKDLDTPAYSWMTGFA